MLMGMEKMDRERQRSRRDREKAKALSAPYTAN
jgi:hypothetical protein